jgi:hypothetical protein
VGAGGDGLTNSFSFPSPHTAAQWLMSHSFDPNFETGENAGLNTIGVERRLLILVRAQASMPKQSLTS